MIGFFYGQTEYNYLENAIHLEKYISICNSYGYEFLTITDKNLHGYLKFYNLCKKNNIKPIIGLEIKCHCNQLIETEILAYAKNDIGLKELFKLSTRYEIDGKVELNYLDNFTNLFYITTKNTNNNNIEQSDNFIKEIVNYSNIFTNLYLGVSNQEDIIFCEKNNFKYLPISKTSFINKNDFKVYSTLKKISGSKEVEINNNYIKTKEELILQHSELAFKYIDEVIKPIIYNEINNKVSLPIFDKDIKDSHNFLEELSKKGLQRRLHINNKLHDKDTYLKRLDNELNIIKQMGFSDYFLIVWDFIKYAKKNNILVGPGRGSAAGSLVSYCLGITEINPIEYNLLFERFLNPQRVSMPDIDIDFPDDKRENVIQYVKEKYGENHVCYISAFNTFGVKSSIRDICRVNNVNLEHVTLMINHIDKFGLEDALEKYKSREDIIEMIDIAKKINGLTRHISTHAAGLILSSIELDENIPLKKGINNVLQSQIEAHDLESKGFLKIDFLGIRNLTLIDKITKMININDLKLISQDDKRTYELLCNGDTNGIFQLESTGIKNVLRKLKPSSFNDIVSVLALYRPGPMENIDLFIERKRTNKIEYLTPELKPILMETYGVIVYQEQIMQIANIFANYTYAEADILRRAMSKKDKKILDENREIFISKAIANNKNEEIAIKLYDLIVKFADYGFNKSHSVAYARLSYEMAYLKANHTKEFLCVMIDNSIGDHKELLSYINYAKTKNITVVTPKINHSNVDTIIVNNKILLGLNTINKVNRNLAQTIFDLRQTSKFSDFDDFKSKTKTILSTQILENFIFSGCFDEFKVSKKAMCNQNLIDPVFAKYNDDTLLKEEEYSFDELKEREFQSLGFNLNFNIFKNYEEHIKTIKCINCAEDIINEKNLTVVAHIENIRELKTKNNESMAFVDLDLNFTKITGVVFPRTFPKFISLANNDLVILSVLVQDRNSELQLVVNDIKKIK